MEDVKESVKQGVSKVAGRLSGMASGVMTQLQVTTIKSHKVMSGITTNISDSPTSTISNVNYQFQYSRECPINLHTRRCKSW